VGKQTDWRVIGFLVKSVMDLGLYGANCNERALRVSHPSKRKGYAAEIQIKDKLVREGIPCERVPLSGSIGGKWTGDLCIPSISEVEFVCEVKARKTGEGFRLLEQWLGDKDILFLRRDRQEPLVVLPFDVFTKLLRAYYERMC
jgi:Holliday junction resolvase